MRVLSCVPEQRHKFDDKISWIETMAKKHRPDLFVTPQEYFGGIQTEYFEEAKGEKIAYTPDEIIKPIQKISRKFNMGIAIGALIDDPILNERRERIFLIDPERGLTAHWDKWALPAYDHVKAKGRTAVFPETDMSKRCITGYVKGAQISAFFCWEVHAPMTWFILSRAKPDFVITQIKFGVKGWPQKTKTATESWVSGFGFGDDGGWIERLHMGAKYDVVAPVVCSTNSWNLPQRSWPLAGTIFPFDGETTLWHPEKGARGTIEEKVIVDEIDFLKWRMIRENKFQYNDVTGEWPSSESRKYTMAFKTRRMERKVLSNDIFKPVNKGLFT